MTADDQVTFKVAGIGLFQEPSAMGTLYDTLAIAAVPANIDRIFTPCSTTGTLILPVLRRDEARVLRLPQPS